MFSKDSLKLKIQTAVTVALIASGIIPAVKAEVPDASVNNPSDTTITNGSTKYAVHLDSGGPYTVINAGIIKTEKSGSTSNISAIEIDEVAVTTLTNTGTMSAIVTVVDGQGGAGVSGINIKTRYRDDEDE